jgi:hypothetical protein
VYTDTGGGVGIATLHVDEQTGDVTTALITQ